MGGGVNFFFRIKKTIFRIKKKNPDQKKIGLKTIATSRREGKEKERKGKEGKGRKEGRKEGKQGRNEGRKEDLSVSIYFYLNLSISINVYIYIYCIYIYIYTYGCLYAQLSSQNKL